MRDPLILNLWLMLAYSLLFIFVSGSAGDVGIELHWAVIIAHAAGLMVFGIARFFKGDHQRNAWKYILASILVAIIGHGLCFFNGLVNFNAH
ncbi:MAG: hypothetical protein IPM12_10625 [Flavobacteriales bacterium]|nr:hypothetical protein [Flavobacteriales bacterium]